MAKQVQPGTLTKKGYAEHRGVSQAYVSKLIREGKLAPPALLPDGAVNVILADQMLGSMTVAAAEPALPLVGGPNYAVERARREAAQAQLAEIELREKRGELLSAAEVQRQVFDKDRRLRDAVLAAAEACASRAHAALNPQAAADIIRAAMQKALGDLATEMQDEAEELIAAEE